MRTLLICSALAIPCLPGSVFFVATPHHHLLVSVVLGRREMFDRLLARRGDFIS